MRTILTSLHSKYIHNSLALPCLAAYCRDHCGELLIREFTVHEPRESVLGMLLAEEPDVIAFSVYIWNRGATLELIDALAVARPGLRIVLGGPEVSFDGAALFAAHPGLSALVHGEGEIPFRRLLSCWQRGETAAAIPRLTLRDNGRLENGGDCPPLTDLDDIPSPFQAGLVSLDRGFVYLETSRGCPYQCSFCMSSLDDRVRSFSMARIQSDLRLLMDHQVARIKLVDRTFNYDPQRAREIFRFILASNRSSHFHFEIGAHLLDGATLDLLKSVPPGMFQFEIGVQSTRDQTLDTVNRTVSLEKLESNVRQLRADGRIQLHLDLVAGLPGETYREFLSSINRVAALQPDHLQIEPVKLLPGSPLRRDAARYGLRFDPHPPYTVLGTADLSFGELEQLRGMSRLLDLTWNSGRFATFLSQLARSCGSLADGLDQLTDFWHSRGLFRFPMSRHDIFLNCWRFVREVRSGHEQAILTEALAYDYALCERVNPHRIPEFFNVDFSEDERLLIKQTVDRAMFAVKDQGIKLQYFSAVFCRLPQTSSRTVLLFLYKTRTGGGRTTEVLTIEGWTGPVLHGKTAV